jgi:hypothetical protein
MTIEFEITSRRGEEAASAPDTPEPTMEKILTDIRAQMAAENGSAEDKPSEFPTDTSMPPRPSIILKGEPTLEEILSFVGSQRTDDTPSRPDEIVDPEPDGGDGEEGDFALENLGDNPTMEQIIAAVRKARGLTL